jgi:hypothetical protein
LPSLMEDIDRFWTAKFGGTLQVWHHLRVLWCFMMWCDQVSNHIWIYMNMIDLDLNEEKKMHD